MWLSFTFSQYCNDSRYSQSLPLFMFSVLLLSWCFASTCFSFGYIVALNKVVLTSVVINLKATACLILYRSITSTKSIMLLALHGNQESPDDRLHYPYQPSRLLTLFLYSEVQLECPFQGASLDMRPWKSVVLHFAGFCSDLCGGVQRKSLVWL